MPKKCTWLCEKARKKDVNPAKEERRRRRERERYKQRVEGGEGGKGGGE